MTLGKHKSKGLDNSMDSLNTWNKKNQKRKELRNALILAPLILIVTGFAVVGFLRLLEACNIL